jgi:hypothetical protein
LRLQAFDGAFPETFSSGKSAVVVAAYSSGAVAGSHRLPGHPPTADSGRRSILVADAEYVKKFHGGLDGTWSWGHLVFLRAGFQLPNRIQIDYHPYLPL